jgi:hypothetical protein
LNKLQYSIGKGFSCFKISVAPGRSGLNCEKKPLSSEALSVCTFIKTTCPMAEYKYILGGMSPAGHLIKEQESNTLFVVGL